MKTKKVEGDSLVDACAYDLGKAGAIHLPRPLAWPDSQFFVQVAP